MDAPLQRSCIYYSTNAGVRGRVREFIRGFAVRYYIKLWQGTVLCNRMCDKKAPAICCGWRALVVQASLSAFFFSFLDFFLSFFLSFFFSSLSFLSFFLLPSFLAFFSFFSFFSSLSFLSDFAFLSFLDFFLSFFLPFFFSFFSSAARIGVSSEISSSSL